MTYIDLKKIICLVIFIHIVCYKNAAEESEELVKSLIFNPITNNENIQNKESECSVIIKSNNTKKVESCKNHILGIVDMFFKEFVLLSAIKDQKLLQLRDSKRYQNHNLTKDFVTRNN